jgi:hypothetical protein
MPKFLTPINLNQLEIQKAVIENYAGSPQGVVSGVEGQMLWDSTNNKFYVNIGTTNWQDVGSGGTDTNTTYGISAETATGGVNLRLTGNDASQDNVKFANGTGITFTRTDADTITVATTVTDTNWYPTTFAWTGGTTAGPTGSLTGTGMSAVSYAAIPAATGSASGIVTTTTQSFGGDKTFSNNVIVTGNLTVNGTTQTINSTTVTIDDPVFTLGGDTAPGADDNKDRGIEFRWHNGSVAKVGFFGFDDSTGKFTFIPDATNTSEVFSGTKGELDANIAWSNVTGTPTFPVKYATTLSTSATSYTVTHNLGSADVVVSVYEVGSPYAEIICDIEHTSTTTCTIKFAVAPSANTYRVVVIG